MRSFANFPKPLDPDEGELTRTRKLRRGFLAERYDGLIEALYLPPGAVDLEIPIRYQDGKRGTLKCAVHVEMTEKAGPLPARPGATDAQRLAVAS